ncbi:hypothetical protein K7X08_026028 [Anisodus acutangulus]|uniref:Uncharacterized protein n=1 Tax=Anisodus acutangulus TaxID=402998 RepID=A0A9Q1RW24_9SOLA|nr:hypothetical protein K7X08_026028 [Anisodus acutangulus]
MACKEATEYLKRMYNKCESSLADNVKDQINILITEFNFLDIFLRLQELTDDSNLQSTAEEIEFVVEYAAETYYSEYSSTDMVHKMQEVIQMCKSAIRARYSYPKLVNIPVKVSLPKYIENFVDNVQENLGNVMSSSSLASSLSIEPEIWKQILRGLHSLRVFSKALWYRINLPSPDTFFAHAIAVTGHTAMIIFMHLPDHKDDQEWEISQINSFLTDLLLDKILPIQPGVRLMYVKLLKSFVSDSSFNWRHNHQGHMDNMLTVFLRCKLLMLRSSYCDGFKVHLEDENQLATLYEMLYFLGKILPHLSSHGFEIELQEIRRWMVFAAISILSLYDKEEVAVLELNNFDLPGLIRRISSFTYRIIRRSFQSNSPRIDGLGFVDFLLDNMKEFLLSHSAYSLPSVKNHLETVLKELVFLHPFLMYVAAEQCTDEHDRLKHLAALVIGKSYEIEYIVDCCMTKDVPTWCLKPWILDLMEEIESVSAEVKRIKEDTICGAQTGNVNNASYVPTSSLLASTSSTTQEMVGFEDVVQMLRNQLVRRSPAQLDVISIVGFSGQGKTIVAKRLFTDELVVSLFEVRAKCFVSTTYKLRDLLADILSDAVDKPTDFCEVPVEKLADKLREILLSKRYLILIDDVCEPRAWDDLKPCFPDANNGSRIILTTRLDEVANYARCVSSPHCLRLFSDKESWMLLQNKVFLLQNCPPHLRDIGQDLVKYCQGIPAMVVVLASVLDKKTKKEWEQLTDGYQGIALEFVEEVNNMVDRLGKNQLHDSQPESNNASKGHTSSEPAGTPGIVEGMVGFEDVMQTLTDQLVRGTAERDVISIVGMAGQGKTTLANGLFIDELVVSRFDVRAKCTVSQVYERRDLLVAILDDANDNPTDLTKVHEAELAVKLRKLLLQKRYLILIDDVWDARAWDDLNSCFPDDNKGSRIIVTTRLVEVADYARCFSSPYHLRLLTSKESWMLLQNKVFLQQSCPPHLIDVGQEIAEKCGRLPLSIVLVAGVLTSMMKKEQWEQVAENLGPHIHANSKHIIEFSYKNLPHHLKPCFLYFGAFLEDKEIPTLKIMMLWEAEGLVVKQNERCLANTAEDYLEDLISRNMVIPTKRSSLGKVKACRIHDLLLDFCKDKAKEENFLLWIYRDQDAGSVEMLSQMLIQRRISIYSKQHNLVERSPSCSNVHSILLRKVGNDVATSINSQVSFAFHSFKCLRVLDLEFVTIDSFPTKLRHLRYLALRTAERSIPSSIANLRNLETLLVKGLKSELSLPHSLCKIVKLRHLHIKNRASFDLHNLEKFLEYPSQLENLETFSTPSFSSAEDAERVLRKTPNIRKLRCMFSGSWGFSEEQNKYCNQFPKLQNLTKLESLKVFSLRCPEKSPCEFNFPSYLKKLTVSGFMLPWSEISTISTLPKLEVLKLQSDAFCGEEWEIIDEHFSQLKVLKLEYMLFERWNVSEDAFSTLEQLFLHGCPHLEKIPPEFGDICSLKYIEVKWCSESVAESARDVEEIQVEEMQNNDFKLSVSK